MKNKSYKVSLVIISVVCVFLAYKVYSLKEENEDLLYWQSENTKIIEKLQLDNTSQQARINSLSSSLNAANQRVRSTQRKMDEANRNLDQAEFWGQAGDEFLSGNSYDAARRNLDGF